MSASNSGTLEKYRGSDECTLHKPKSNCEAVSPHRLRKLVRHASSSPTHHVALEFLYITSSSTVGMVLGMSSLFRVGDSR